MLPVPKRVQALQTNGLLTGLNGGATQTCRAEAKCRVLRQLMLFYTHALLLGACRFWRVTTRNNGADAHVPLSVGSGATQSGGAARSDRPQAATDPQTHRRSAGDLAVMLAPAGSWAPLKQW